MRAILSTYVTVHCIILAVFLPEITLAIEASDYGWVRILEPPAEHPPADCEAATPTHPYVHACGAGLGYAGGIDNDGNVVGPLETNFPSRDPWMELGRWLRSNNYTGENMRRFRIEAGHLYQLNTGALVSYPGPPEAPTAWGFIRVQKVTSEGQMYGVANIGNGSMARYDIKNDQWWSFGFAQGGGGGNNHGLMVDGWKQPGALFGEFDSRVVDSARGSTEPVDPDVQGNLQVFSANPFGASIYASDINDDNIIIGGFGTGDDFPTNGDPIKILPDGENHWSEDYVVMEELALNSVSRAIHLSDSDPPFAIGYSTNVDHRRHGVLWNVATGELKADFGFDLCAQRECGAHAISPDGTMVVGARSEGFGPFGTREHFIFWSDDGWETWQELNVNDILTVAEGGEHIAQITKLTGINDHGQISAQALLKGEFGQYATAVDTAWLPEIATDPNCPDSWPGEWAINNGCGIPIVLDTQTLLNLLEGDVNNDGVVNFLDITPFINAQSAESDQEAFLLLTPNGCFLCADINMDGAIDFLDITPYINLLDQVGTVAVPEPASAILLIAGLIAARRKS